MFSATEQLSKRNPGHTTDLVLDLTLGLCVLKTKATLGAELKSVEAGFPPPSETL